MKYKCGTIQHHNNNGQEYYTMAQYNYYFWYVQATLHAYIHMLCVESSFIEKCVFYISKFLVHVHDGIRHTRRATRRGIELHIHL